MDHSLWLWWIVGSGMFRGLYEHTIDAKGRTSLPARFRELLNQSIGKSTEPQAAPQGEDDAAPAEAEPKPNDANTLIVTTGIDRCLVAYPLPAWQAFESKLAGLSQFDPAVVQLKRIYVAGATECVIDKHGRLLIPPVLREYAGFTRDLIWAGMVTTIEIWAKELWSDQVTASRSDPKAIARALSELGL